MKLVPSRGKATVELTTSPSLTSLLFCAAHQFHLLTLSQAILLDGPKRAILDVKLETAKARAEKTAGYESKKRGMVNVSPALSSLLPASTNPNLALSAHRFRLVV